MPELVQVSPEIDALTHEEWLVSHHDARHDPPIRAALEAIGTVLSAASRFAPQTRAQPFGAANLKTQPNKGAKANTQPI